MYVVDTMLVQFPALFRGPLYAQLACILICLALHNLAGQRLRYIAVESLGHHGQLCKLCHGLDARNDGDGDAGLAFALEFRNNSGSDFYGHDGQTVFNGGYFYLFGMLEYSKGEQPGSTTLGAVFVQDHVTKVTFRITSLAEAYVTIPDLHSCPMLEMGVRAEINWTLSTPIDLPLI